MKDPGPGKPSFPCEKPGCDSRPFSTNFNRKRHVVQKHSPPTIMPCGKELKTHASNTKRHISECGKCRSEMERPGRVGSRPKSVDGVDKDTTRALLESRQNPQRRTLFDSGTSSSTSGLEHHGNSHVHGKESDLHFGEFPHVQAMTKADVSGHWRAIPDNLDPEVLGFALPDREDFESSAQDQSLSYSGAEFEQVHSPVTGEAPGDTPADWTQISFFDEAFWTQHGDRPNDTVDESEDGG